MRRAGKCGRVSAPRWQKRQPCSHYSWGQLRDRKHHKMNCLLLRILEKYYFQTNLFLRTLLVLVQKEFCALMTFVLCSLWMVKPWYRYKSRKWLHATYWRQILMENLSWKALAALATWWIRETTKSLGVMLYL